MYPRKEDPVPNTKTIPTVVSPLAETLERVSAARMEDGKMDLSTRWSVSDEPGWTTVAILAADRELLTGTMDSIGRAYKTDNRPFVGTALIRGYLWRMMRPAVAVLLAERRLPDLRAGNVALRFGDSSLTEDVAFTGSRFAVLPDDPDVGHPDAVVLPSEEALLGWMRGAMAETHLPFLIPALRGLGVRRGTRAMQRVFVDSCAEAFMFVGRELGCEAEALELAERLLSGPPPLSGPTNFYLLDRDGEAETSRVRNTCCLYYKVAAGACFTCPRTTHEERLRRLAEK